MIDKAFVYCTLNISGECKVFALA